MRNAAARSRSFRQAEAEFSALTPQTAAHLAGLTKEIDRRKLNLPAVRDPSSRD